MPLYEFRCKKCGHEFDRIQKMDDPCPKCPKVVETEAPDAVNTIFDGDTDTLCEGETERLISQSTFHLKGSGWAADGY